MERGPWNQFIRKLDFSRRMVRACQEVGARHQMRMVDFFSCDFRGETCFNICCFSDNLNTYKVDDLAGLTGANISRLTDVVRRLDWRVCLAIIFLFDFFSINSPFRYPSNKS